MDLSTFQLVDAINDMDMLRNLSDQQQRQQHHQQQQQGHVGQEQQQQHYQQQQQPQQASNHNAYDQLHGDIDLLFQQQNQTSSPHMHSFLPTTTSSAYKNHHPSTNQIMPTSSPHYRSTPLQQPTQHHDYMDQEVYNNKSMYKKQETIY
jgi:type II secretory pathway pseudopilin PulG